MVVQITRARTSGSSHRGYEWLPRRAELSFHVGSLEDLRGGTDSGISWAPLGGAALGRGPEDMDSG